MEPMKILSNVAQCYRIALQRMDEIEGIVVPPASPEFVPSPENLLCPPQKTPRKDRNKREGRGTKRSWDRIRNEVYWRDKGICQVCKTDVPLALYDCGHIIDVVEGGSDRKSNLLLMCRICNLRKPLHKTRKAFWAWVESGDWKSPLTKFIEKHGDEPEFKKAILEHFGVDEHGDPLG